MEVALSSVERALPEVEHVGIGVYEVAPHLAHAAGQADIAAAVAGLLSVR